MAPKPTPTGEPTRKFIAGHRAMEALLTYWIARSNISHEQFCRCAAWALGEDWLRPSTISRLKTGAIPSGPNMRQLVAFDALNVAIWRWQTQGAEAAWERYGPHSTHAIRDHWLSDAIWLPVPEHPTEPLEFEDFTAVMVGRLVLPYLDSVHLEGADAAELSDLLSGLINAEISGMGPRDAMAAVLAAYPVAAEDRRSRLMAVILGMGTFTAAELQAELWDVAEVLRVLRKVPRGKYGPDQLAAELRAGLSRP